MNNYEDDGLDDIFGTVTYESSSFLDDPHSPTFGGGMEQLQIPFHDDAGPSYDMGYNNDLSLSVPMQDYTPEPPRLSPAGMPSYQMHDYEMSHESQINSQGYNSFEQPVGVINGEQSYPVEDVSLQPVDNGQPQYSYADEMPSTSGHNVAHASTSSRSHQPVARSQPPPRNTSAPSNRNRPLQPKTSSSSSSSNKRRTGGNEQPQQTMEVRVSPETNQRISQIMAEIAILQQQQSTNNIDNSSRLNELQNQLMAIFQVDKAAMQAEAPPPPPPVSKPSRSRPSGAAARRSQQQKQQQQQHHHQTHQTHPQQFDDDDGYQPQMTMMPPSTSQHQSYSDYQQQRQPVMVQQPPVQQHQPPQQVVRIQHVQAVSTSQSGQHQQLIYVQPSGQQYVQQTVPTSQAPGRTYVTTTHQPIQPKPPQLARVLIKPPHTMPSTSQVSYTAQIVPSSRIQPPQLQHPPPPHVHHHHQPPQLQPQVLTPPPPQQQQQYVFVRPPKQSSANIAQIGGERRHSRQQRLKGCLAALHDSVTNPDTERPFKDMGDVIKRLLGFHALAEPDLKQEEIDTFDSNMLRTNINLDNKVKDLKGRLLTAIYKEPQVINPPEEQNLLLYLDMEYEKRKLEEEQAAVNDYNRLDFVRNSQLLPALRGTVPQKPTPLPHPPKSVQQYEYYPFTEVPQLVSPCRSPYIMSPSTSSHRSISPVKTPASFHSPRLRQRSTTWADEPEPVDIKPVIKAVDKKTAGERRAAEKKEREALKTKQEPRPVHIKPETVDTGYDKAERAAVKPAPISVRSPPKPFKQNIKIKEEPQASTSYAPPEPLTPRTGLPSKKMFLNRHRNEAPPALRSPPALMLRPVSAGRTNGMDSDGSVSPELGDFGDGSYVQPPRAPITPITPVAPAISDIKSQPLKKLAPLPAPQPKKTEIKETAVPAVGKIVFKYEGSKAATKPDVSKKKQPPAKTEPVRLEVKNEPVATKSSNGTFHGPPIRLKLKLGNNEVSTLILGAGNEKENKHNEEERRRRKEEKKRKKAEKREKKRAERERRAAAEEDKKEEYVSIHTGGLRIKLKRNYSRTNTPALPHEPAAAPPSTSRVNGSLSQQQPEQQQEMPPLPKVPKLKIKLGLPPVERRVEAAPEAVAPVSRPMPKPMNGPSIFNSNLKPQGDLPPVTFSDESDGDDDLRRATDETMRSWGMTFKTNSIPAYPSHP